MIYLIPIAVAVGVIIHHGYKHKHFPWYRKWFDIPDLWHLVHSHEGIIALLLYTSFWLWRG